MQPHLLRQIDRPGGAGACKRFLAALSALLFFGLLATCPAAPHNEESKPKEGGNKKEAAKQKPADPRQAIFEEALERGAREIKPWPATPEALIQAFWEAAHKHDYQRLILFCPGAEVSDFKFYYDHWTPSDKISIGQPSPHPKQKEVMVYPVTVPFPWFPHKIIKMGLTKAPDGRPIIAGRQTKWWW